MIFDGQLSVVSGHLSSLNYDNHDLLVSREDKNVSLEMPKPQRNLQ
jgi:hypothetical protein